MLNPTEIKRNKERAKTMGMYTDYIVPQTPKLLTLSSAKLDKASVAGKYLQAGLNLQPANSSGVEMCPGSIGSPCRDMCLDTSGRNIFDEAWNARQWKTVWYRTSPSTFFTQLVKEVAKFERYARLKDLVPVFRADLLSDTALGARLSSVFRGRKILFSDYTKIPEKAFRSLKADNYHVSLSYSGLNWASCEDFLEAGGRVSMVFEGELPTSYESYPVVNGDKHDFHFLAPRGVIWGLVSKGAAKKAPSNSFIMRV